MKFVNLTEHPILLPGGVRIEPSRDENGHLRIARCSRQYITVKVVDGVELTREILTNVTGLPESDNGTIFIVSQWVRRAASYRSDLASPGRLLFDENRNIIGAINLVIN